MTHKQFLLEKALTGEEVIDGQGNDVKHIHHFPEIKRLAGIIDGVLLTWNENGIWDNNGTPSKYDLCLKSKEVTYKVGDQFRIEDDIYLLSSISITHCALICIEGDDDIGLRYTEAKEVNDIYNITNEELNALMNGAEFELLEN